MLGKKKSKWQFIVYLKKYFQKNRRNPLENYSVTFLEFFYTFDLNGQRFINLFYHYFTIGKKFGFAYIVVNSSNQLDELIKLNSFYLMVLLLL
jgi:hypothetical protein